MQPGMVALFGSGETAPSGRKAHEQLLAMVSAPAKIAILDTPAGFQPNVDLVAEKIKRYFERHLQNFRPQVFVVRARAKGTRYDPDDPALIDALLDASYIFAGPGSPSYAVRQLAGTRALANILEGLRRGAVLGLASAAAIAGGRYALPVYEIFKAGHDLHWLPGLDLLGSFGLELAIVTHWNNREGGAELDTSRCYMGQERFRALAAMLPATTTVLGIDEHTSCLLDLKSDRGIVIGAGSVSVLRAAGEACYSAGESFGLEALRAGALRQKTSEQSI